MDSTSKSPSKARIGMRYGSDWFLKPGVLFSETSGLIFGTDRRDAGVTPLVPSLKAAVQGVRECYGSMVMGLDPEFFLRRGTEIVPAFDYLPSKHATEDGLFWDGFQAETTVDLWSHLESWETSRGNPAKAVKCHAIIAQRLGKQLQLLRKHGLNIAPRSVWRIPPDILRFASEAHVALGCDPSRNVYGTFPRVVERPRGLGWRFAGGHIHFTLPEAERKDEHVIRYLVKTLDALLGIPCVCLAQNYDHFIRRRYYGLAGEYRLPKYGLEYRTLSNFWVNDPRAFMLVFDLARHALGVGLARLRNIFTGPERAIRDTINYCDVRSARDFMRLNKEFYTSWSEDLYGHSKSFWEAIQGGVDKVIPGFGRDVLDAWILASDWRDVKAWKDLK